MPHLLPSQSLLPIEVALATEYPVMEHFYTIQGEGMYAGVPAYFIRLGGCDVQCWWCDVKDSWDAEKHPRRTVQELLTFVLEAKAKTVVITGGEPLMHNLVALTQVLHSHGIAIHLETSGSSPLSGHIDWVTLSPKRFKLPESQNYAFVDELKVVIVTKKDLAWAETHAGMCPSDVSLLLQPEWDTPKMIPPMIEYVKTHPQWRISLQTHKYLNVP